MTRQLEQGLEEREAKRRDALVYALDRGISDALELQGIELLGIAFKHDAYSCLMTIKASIGGERQVCFVGSDTIVNSILKAAGDARADALHWRTDKFHIK